MYTRMEDDLDVTCDKILEGGENLQEVKQRNIDLVPLVAS